MARKSRHIHEALVRRGAEALQTQAGQSHDIRNPARDSYLMVRTGRSGPPRRPPRGRGRPRIPVSTQLRLWVSAGGRCSFNGCNKVLWRHGLTLTRTNLSNIAHIVAHSPDGPRGDDPLPLAHRNRFENLMLACLECHHVIDDKRQVVKYPVQLLQKFKRDHESRIEQLTGIHPEAKTRVVCLRGTVRCQPVVISHEQIDEAIFPRYRDVHGEDIDFTAIPHPTQEPEWQARAKDIDDRLAAFNRAGLDREAPKHVSVFAVAPIPLLVHLGTVLSNKIPCRLYQRHRTPEHWRWETVGRPVRYAMKQIRKRGDTTRVGLLLSLSGTVQPGELPDTVARRCPLYEVTLAGQRPNPTFLRRSEDVDEFVKVYHRAFERIRRENPTVREVHLFAAVPAPIAVACGREILRDAYPTLVVYDLRAGGGYALALKENRR